MINDKYIFIMILSYDNVMININDSTLRWRTDGYIDLFACYATAQGFLVVTNSTVVRRLGAQTLRTTKSKCPTSGHQLRRISHSTSMLEVCIKSARAAMTIYHGLGGLTTNSFSQQFWRLETKIKVLAQLVLLNQVHLPNMQWAKYWNAKVYSQSLYTRKPSEEMGETVSDLPPQGRRTECEG